MTAQELAEFLAWVEDEFIYIEEDAYEYVDGGGTFTREQVAEMYLDR